MECIIHNTNVDDSGKLSTFSDTAWAKVKEYKEKWSGLNLKSREQPQCQVANTSKVNFESELALESYGYHRECYSWFTNKTTYNRAVIKNVKCEESEAEDEWDTDSDTNDNQPPAKRVTRSKAPCHITSKPVLPKICVICGKAESRYSVRGKRKWDVLTRCETIDAGKLKAAAANDDSETGRRIRTFINDDTDCVAAEVHYHRHEYNVYTKSIYSKERNEKNLPDAEKQAYHRAFDQLCHSTIDVEIFQKRKTMKMDDLLKLYRSILLVEDKIDAKSYRNARLKERMVQRYGLKLCFYKPANPRKCQVVFADSTTAADILLDRPSGSETPTSSEVETHTGETTEVPDTPVKVDRSKSLQVLFNAAMMLRDELRTHEKHETGWPPVPDDFDISVAERLIPVPLYNTIAWVCGLSTEPTLEQFVKLDRGVHLKLISILQDVISLAPNRGRLFTPKAYSLGITIKHWTGSTRLIGLLNKLGHAVSADSVRSLETALAQVQLNNEDELVYRLRKQVHTVLVYDNIDFSEETLTGHGQTHVTNALAIQESGVDVHPVMEEASSTSRISRSQRSLQAQSTQLAAYQKQKRMGPKTFVDGHLQFPDLPIINHDRDALYLLLKSISNSTQLPGWTGYNTELTRNDVITKSDITYLPVIQGSPTSLDTVLTILQNSLKIADKLEREDIVLVFDQAIYCKAQEIRWLNPEIQSKTVIRLGEFHLLMSYSGVIGKRFQEAGLTDLLVESGLVAPGSINGVINGHHYNRAVRCHKVLFEALGRMRFESYLDTLDPEKRSRIQTTLEGLIDVYPSNAFKRECQSVSVREILLDYEEHVRKRCGEDETYQFWSSYLDMVSLLLELVRATRTSDWDRHLLAVRAILPWFFTYNHQNYARYLPVYLMEMLDLPRTNPAIHEEFERGKWTVTRHVKFGFASSPCDQVMEQTLNRDCKTSGGIVGFTMNTNAVQRWLLAQPERAAITRKCEQLAGINDDKKERKELNESEKKRNESFVQNVIETVSQFANPFDCDGSKLMNICSGIIPEPEAGCDALQALELGEKAVKNFVDSRVLSSDVPFHDTMKKMQLRSFVTKGKSKKGKAKTQLSGLDYKIFARLLIVRRDSNMNVREVMKFSLGDVSFPLSTLDGGLASTTKSNLRKYILSQNDCTVEQPMSGGATIVDGMSLVQSIKLGSLMNTFGELAKAVITMAMNKAKKFKSSRLDIVFDTYPSISIKSFTHIKRGSSEKSQARRIVSAEQTLPKQWKNYLSHGKNKELLIEFFFSEWKRTDFLQVQPELQFVVVSHGRECHSINTRTGDVQPVHELFSDHEEADTRLILHTMNTYMDTTIVSCDTDVFILSLYHKKQIPTRLHLMISATDLVDITKLSNTLGMQTCDALPGFHCFTGCDSVSAFHGKGKTGPLKLMLQSKQYTENMTQLGQSFNLDLLPRGIEKFVSAIYASKESLVDEARYKLFLSKSFGARKLPPTQDALTMHTKRANYQCAIMKRASEPMINAPSPAEHGWEIDHETSVVSVKWMTQPAAPAELLTQTKCSCKKTECATKACSCVAKGISCSDACNCQNCNNLEATEVEKELEKDVSDLEDSDEEEI